MNYNDFLKSKEICIKPSGFDMQKAEMNAHLFDWQKDVVHWALRKGRAALFENCGLGKTIQQLEFSRCVSEKCSRPVLIVSPLAVAEQTRREGEKFGYTVTVCRSQQDVQPGINITNYEMLEHFDAGAFCGVVLDESSILKNFSSKVKTKIIDMFRLTEYKLSCSATPAPNDYMELGNQAEFLGIMSRTEMLATYFVHDGGDTSKWRLKGHAADRFWEWVATWAVVLTKPSDLGYDDAGYELPSLHMNEHIVSVESKNDELTLFPEFKVAQTLTERRDARRNSLTERCAKAAELVTRDEQWLVWCDLNSESSTLCSMIPGAVEVKGSDDPATKAQRLNGFTDGSIRCLVTKPSIAGFGLNWQGCHNMIFVGLSDSYEQLYQAIRRCWRFGQEKDVNVHIITSATEGAVRENIERKERQSEQMIEKMVKHTREILEQEIRGTVRITIAYDPHVLMQLPDWLGNAS